MKILIIEKMLKKSREFRERAENIEYLLSKRGHEVNLVESLSTNLDLSKYSVSIVHPKPYDAKILIQHLRKSPEFRTLLCTVDNNYKKLYRESDQVSTYFPTKIIHYKRVVRLVEKGW